VNIAPSAEGQAVELLPAPWWANALAGITRRLPAGKSRLIEGMFGDSARRFIGAMPRELGGCRFECCLRDVSARELFFGGCIATQEISLVRATLRPGMSFVDVGANWGFFTMVAARLVGSSGRVMALEPDPRIFAMLAANVKRNQLEQVQAFPVAAADGDSNLVLAGHSQDAGNWAISRLVKNPAPAQVTFNVPSRTLDSLLDQAGLETVDLVKIDVEGAEDLVLQGMRTRLRTERYRAILLELHPQHLPEQGSSVDEVINLLREHGYKGYTLDHSPKAIRRAYYHPWTHFSEYIRPLEQPMRDDGRHTFWLAPSEPEFT
jgi:FkbM family methyltransferase